jgi:hypothetical protein
MTPKEDDPERLAVEDLSRGRKNSALLLLLLLEGGQLFLLLAEEAEDDVGQPGPRPATLNGLKVG